MAYTIKESFRIFKENLEITDRQLTIVSNCKTNVVKTLQDSSISLHEKKSLVIGSYDRYTLIKPLSSGDVDLLIILHYGNNKEYDNAEGTIKMLDRFKYALEQKYKTTEMRRDRNCITMKLSEFSLDIVPAFSNKDGYFTIPDSIDKVWLKTNPIKFAELLTSVNSSMDGTFKPLIKMVKAWNISQGKPLRGYHIECLMYHRYKSYIQSYTYDSMIREFFNSLSFYLNSYTLDPVMGGYVDSYLGSFNDQKRINVIERARIAYERSKLAVEYAEKENIEDSIRLWRQIFGDYFPAFG